MLSVIRGLALALASLGWLLLCLWLVLPRHSQAVGERAGQRAEVFLPWMFHGAGRNFNLEVELEVNAFTTKHWNVICDDQLRSLAIDGQPVPLEAVPQKAREDYQRGFDLDLSPWLTGGTHTLSFVFDNRTGGAGIQLNPLLGARWVLVWLGFLPWLFWLGRTLRVTRAQLVVLAASLCVLLLAWSKTPWSLRAHDVDPHLAYFNYLITKLRIPPPNGGWAFFHPPLYYFGGAGLMQLGRSLHLTGLQLVQAFSVWLWLTFLIASAGALRLTLGKRSDHALVIATLGVALWPAGVLHSMRIGNDAMLYATSALATYFLVSWWQRGHRGALVLASLFVGLSMVAKSSGAVMIAAAGLLFLLRTTRERAWRSGRTWVDALLGLTLVGSGMAACFANGIYHYAKGRIPNWLVANANLLPDFQRVPNDVHSLLVLDLPTFLTEPFLHVGRDETGRSNFWNTLLRTGLVGEWEYSAPAAATISLVMGALLIALLLGLLRPGWRLLRSPRRRWAAMPWLVLSFAWIASIFVLRVQIPYACSNNFRYVLPVIVPFALACAAGSRFTRVLLAMLGACTPFFVFWLP